MISALSRFLFWILRKFAVAIIVVVAGVAGVGTWFFLQDHTKFGAHEGDRVENLIVERDRYLTEKAAAETRLGDLQAELASQKERLGRTEIVVTNLKALDTWKERAFGDREQLRANVDQLAHVTHLRNETKKRISDLQHELNRTRYELDGIELALVPLERRLDLAVQIHARVLNYTIAGWQGAKWWIALVLLLYYLGPPLTRMFLFYLIAPRIVRSRPVHLEKNASIFPEVGGSQNVATVSLWPGEILRVKRMHLLTADPGLTQQTRGLFDWRIPFTSMLCGLTDLVEIRNRRVGEEKHVMVIPSEMSGGELAIVDVPEGSSLVLRPSFLVGLIQPDDAKLKIRRRWQLFRWQAWVTLQFRFFEFGGPCRMIVAGEPAVRVEHLNERETHLAPIRRSAQDATIGFTPNLEYRPLRAERFRTYVRGRSRLYDDGFKGTGLFLARASVANARPKRFWPAFRNGALKVLGM